MAIYSVGRRRIIVVLLLTSVLLLTLDLRGNAVLDRVRDGFAVAMTPVEVAADVVTSPVERAWESYRGYDALARETEALRERLARLDADSVVGFEHINCSHEVRMLRTEDDRLAKRRGLDRVGPELVVERATHDYDVREFIDA